MNPLRSRPPSHLPSRTRRPAEAAHVSQPAPIRPLRLDRLPFRGGTGFLGLPDEDTRLDDARAVILPVPYDGTTSYQAGTRTGPAALLAASRNVELYDLELDCEPLSHGHHTLPELEPTMNGPAAMVERVETAVAAIAAAGRLPVMIGGEHSLTTGPVRALARHHRDLTILQLDAHADLRDEFEDTPFSHASVMRRCLDHARIVQVGIRNLCQAERTFARATGQEARIFYAHQLAPDPAVWLDGVVAIVGDGPVYVTVDLDVFDGAVMPATGTPEPGGLSWLQVVSLLDRVMRRCQVVGLDLVELCPIPGLVAPDFLAAKLLFKMLGTLFVRHGWQCRQPPPAPPPARAARPTRGPRPQPPRPSPPTARPTAGRRSPRPSR